MTSGGSDKLQECGTAVPPLPEASVNRQNTIFVHPGLLSSGLDWDSSLAVDAGARLIAEGFGRQLAVLQERDAEPIYRHAVGDPGTQFVGIHYSMGGRPDILRNSLDSIKRASEARGVALRYHALLFDPFGISDIGAWINIDEPELGYVFILLSSENSFLRPGIQGLPHAFARSRKVVFVYSESFGEDWGHFGMLTAYRNRDLDGHEQEQKVKALFEGMLALALRGDGTSFSARSVADGCPEPESAPMSATRRMRD